MFSTLGSPVFLFLFFIFKCVSSTSKSPSNFIFLLICWFHHTRDFFCKYMKKKNGVVKNQHQFWFKLQLYTNSSANWRLGLVSISSWDQQRLLFSHSHICSCRSWLSNDERQSEARCDIRSDKWRQTELVVCHRVLLWCWFTAALVVSTHEARCRLVGLLCQIWRRWHDGFVWYRLMFHTQHVRTSFSGGCLKSDPGFLSRSSDVGVFMSF